MSASIVSESGEVIGQVVFCAECAHLSARPKNGKHVGKMRCSLHSEPYHVHFVDPLDYCSHAEKKEVRE